MKHGFQESVARVPYFFGVGRYSMFSEMQRDVQTVTRFLVGNYGKKKVTIKYYDCYICKRFITCETT